MLPPTKRCIALGLSGNILFLHTIPQLKTNELFAEGCKKRKEEIDRAEGNAQNQEKSRKATVKRM